MISLNTGLLIAGMLVLAAAVGPLGSIQASDAQTKGLTSIVVGGNPTAAVYNPSNGYVYVATDFAGSVVLLSGPSVVENMSLAKIGYPVYLAYDPQHSYVYASVENPELPTLFNGTISIISGTKVISNVTVGGSPGPLVYDPSNGYVYCLTRSITGVTVVSVFSGTQVLASIRLGLDAGFVAVDTENGYVYVSNFGSDTVSVISGVQVLGTVNVGPGPQDVVYDPASGQIFVALNAGPPQVVVISGTTLLTTIGGLEPPLVYDPADQEVYAVSGSRGVNVSLISGTNVVATVAPPVVPGSSFGYNRLYYDPYDSQVYLFKDEPNPVFGRLFAISGSSITSSTDISNYSSFASLGFAFLLASPGDHNLYVAGYSRSSVTLIPPATVSPWTLVDIVLVAAVFAAVVTVVVVLGIRRFRSLSLSGPKVI